MTGSRAYRKANLLLYFVPGADGKGETLTPNPDP